MRYLSAPLVVLVLGAAACAQPRPEAEKNAALDAHIRCTRSAIVRLDDGRSDASSIALGVDGACSKEWLDYLDVALHQFSATERQQIRPALERQKMKLIAADVLDYRSKRRSNG